MRTVGMSRQRWCTGRNRPENYSVDLWVRTLLTGGVSEIFYSILFYSILIFICIRGVERFRCTGIIYITHMVHGVLAKSAIVSTSAVAG